MIKSRCDWPLRVGTGLDARHHRRKVIQTGTKIRSGVSCSAIRVTKTQTGSNALLPIVQRFGCMHDALHVIVKVLYVALHLCLETSGQGAELL